MEDDSTIARTPPSKHPPLEMREEHLLEFSLGHSMNPNNSGSVNFWTVVEGGGQNVSRHFQRSFGNPNPSHNCVSKKVLQRHFQFVRQQREPYHCTFLAGLEKREAQQYFHLYCSTELPFVREYIAWQRLPFVRKVLLGKYWGSITEKFLNVFLRGCLGLGETYYATFSPEPISEASESGVGPVSAPFLGSPFLIGKMTGSRQKGRGVNVLQVGA